MSGLFDPMEVARLSSDSKDFILALMERWNVTDIYPPSLWRRLGNAARV
jgi:hypothetical protein